MKLICELNDEKVLGTSGMANVPPRLTARAILKNNDGLYAVMYSEKFNLYSLPGGGVEENEDIQNALKREIAEETGCRCDKIFELGIVSENRASLNYTQINYYYIVHTALMNEPMLTENERANKTCVQWKTFDEVYHLITDAVHTRVQGKYLQARDVAALKEYISQK